MKITCLILFILAMLLLPVSGKRIEESTTVDGSGGRCQWMMDPDDCNLSSCKQRCLMQKNGNGVCLANLRQGSYRCVCYINC